MKVKFNNSEEIEITEEEFENLADKLINSGWHISNISYSFPGYDDLNNTMNSSFSENVTIVGNNKNWIYMDTTNRNEIPSTEGE